MGGVSASTSGEACKGIRGKVEGSIQATRKATLDWKKKSE